MIEIREVKTRKDKKLFATFPVKLYKDCAQYVPSLVSDEINNFNPKKNASLNVCEYKGFLAFKDGELVGRIAGIINKPENEITGGKFIRFSRLDCIDDAEVFNQLLCTVADYGRKNGLKIMHGPWGFNDTDREGMLTFGFDKESTYSTNYSFPYYHENMEKLGFQDESKWIEMLFDIPNEVDERSARLCDRIKAKYHVRDVADTMSVKEILDTYGEKFFDTYNLAYGSLDGFVPVSDKAMQKNVLDQFAVIVNTRYVSILIDDKEQVAGFGICLPSICKPLKKHKGRLLPGLFSLIKAIKKPKELEMALIAVRPEYRNAGINALIINRIMKNIIDDKIEKVESNPMLETNLSIQQQWKFAGREIIKKRQTYVIDVDKLLG